MHAQKRVVALAATAGVAMAVIALVVIRRNANETSSRVAVSENAVGTESAADVQGETTKPTASVSVDPAATDTPASAAPAVAPLSSPAVRARVRDARRLLEQGHAAAAESLLLQVTAAAPQSASAWNVIGRTRLALNRADEAEEAFARACELDSTHAWAHNNLGWLHLQHEEWQMALPLLETAVRLNSDVAVFHNNLGVAYERARRFDDAAREYARALELLPAHATAGEALARVRLRVPLATAEAADSLAVGRN